MVEAANADPSDGDEIERGPLAIDRLIETGRPEVLRRGAVNELLDSGPTRAGVESCDNANCGRHKSGLDPPTNLGGKRGDGVTRLSCFSLR